MNEPEVHWDTPAMRARWTAWQRARYGHAAAVPEAWGNP